MSPSTVDSSIFKKARRTISVGLAVLGDMDSYFKKCVKIIRGCIRPLSPLTQQSRKKWRKSSEERR
jgi:hypothetical protein